MDILDIIKNDHTKAMNLFDDIENMERGTAVARSRTFQDLKKELTQHMDAEEEVFYPALEVENKKDILEAIEEHNVARMVSDEIDSADVDADRWMAKLAVFRELIEHHVEEEEGKIFDEARENLSKEKLSDLGRQFEDSKSKTMKAAGASARAGTAR